MPTNNNITLASLASDKRALPLICGGIALTSLATLILELSITRLFSVILYYHFAFLAISIALFGIGIGGVLSYSISRIGGNVFQKLAAVSAINGLLVLGCLLFILSLGGRLGPGTLVKIYFVSTIPFIGAGIVLSIVIAETSKRVNVVYLFDLLGAGLGCIALIPLLNNIGGPNTILLAGVLYAASGAVWALLGRFSKSALGCGVAAVLLLGVIGINRSGHLVDIKWAKGMPLPNERFVKWNSFSRIALVDHGNGVYTIDIDADANTYVTGYDPKTGTEAQRNELLGKGQGLAYRLRPQPKALVIGPGGGVDVSRALASGSKDVTGVEINPIIANTIMRERYPELSGRLYFRPEVRLVIEDGRSYVRRSSEKYDVIQATLVDTWASTAAGAFSLSENNLYTTEAFHDYLSHLTDRGMLAFTRWGFPVPRESLRVVALAREALEQMGETAPGHIIVLREPTRSLAQWGDLDTILVSRKPFTEADLAQARTFAQAGGLDAMYIPGQDKENAFSQFLASSDPKDFERGYTFDVSPVGDDRPFFFYTVRTRDVLAFMKQYLADRVNKGQQADAKSNIAVPVLFAALGVSFFATLLIMLLPPLIKANKLPNAAEGGGHLLYFMFVGIGYISVEVALIQKFILLLGHPTYSLTVVVFTLLMSSGLGSYLSVKVVQDQDRRLHFVLAAIFGLIVLLAVTVGPLMGVSVGWPLSLRIVTTILLIAPLGFFMGMPFPTGLRKLDQAFPNAVRWAWSVNAASSVFGSVLAMMIAIHFGLKLTMMIGGALYLCAALFARTNLVAVANKVPAGAEAGLA